MNLPKVESAGTGKIKVSLKSGKPEDALAFASEDFKKKCAEKGSFPFSTYGKNGYDSYIFTHVSVSLVHPKNGEEYFVHIIRLEFMMHV